MKLRHTPIRIQADELWLDGSLAHAPDVHAVVLLLAAGGDVPPDRAAVQAAGFATLDVELLGAQEIAAGADAAFDIPRLARRLAAVLAWMVNQPPLGQLKIGIVAGGSAAAAAVRTLGADAQTFPVSALVVRGGRPDLAGAGPLRTLALPTRFVLQTGAAGEDIARRAFALLPPALADWPATASAADDEAAVLDWLQRWLPRPQVAPSD